MQVALNEVLELKVSGAFVGAICSYLQKEVGMYKQQRWAAIYHQGANSPTQLHAPADIS
jgi:hypothetical protein